MALFGRDWLQKCHLDWHEIKVLRVQNTGLKDILDANKSVFSDGLGKLQNLKASIYLEDDAQLKFHKARTVPYAMRGKTGNGEELLNHLKANLEKCEFFKDNITYCGHIINAGGLQKSPVKVNAVLNAPKPENA